MTVSLLAMKKNVKSYEKQAENGSDDACHLVVQIITAFNGMQIRDGFY